MFSGFKKKFVKVSKGKIFCRFKGVGPPLLLLHGYPQTHVMWHKTAPELSKYFTVILADLRGYGDSFVLTGGTNHKNYSKREMAKDMVELMNQLNFNRFFVAGHDRGGRVAHRMARDFRDKIIALSVLDICPTLDMYELTDMKFAKGYFHWFYLIQPAPFPEKMIMENPKRWLKSRFNRSPKGFFRVTEGKYLRTFKQKKRIYATCEDYRAAATIDLEHDKKDRKKKLNIPIQVLWGKKGVVGKQFNPIKIWQKYTNKKVYGVEINSEHFIPEESPKQTVKYLKLFFLKNVKNNT
tara:strand:- start:256 stop:1140 length:885 start_codon:yes stop_codon:yes gene_type:complete